MLRVVDVVAACERQGLEVLGVGRHASRGRDMQPFMVAHKPLGLVIATDWRRP